MLSAARNFASVVVLPTITEKRRCQGRSGAAERKGGRTLLPVGHPDEVRVLGVRIDELAEPVSVRLCHRLPHNELEVAAHELPDDFFVRLKLFVGPRHLGDQIYQPQETGHLALARLGLGVARLGDDIGEPAQRCLGITLVAVRCEREQPRGLVELIVLPRGHKTPLGPAAGDRLLLEQLDGGHP